MKKRKKISFLYNKPDGDLGWRTIELIREDNKFIKGMDNTKHFKQFNKSNILSKVYVED